MPRDLSKRASRNVKILLDIIAQSDKFTAEEMQDLFAKSNHQDVWIEGCSSVEEFLNNLVKLGDLDCVLVPSVVYFHSPKKSDDRLRHCGKNIKILFDIIDSKLRFTLEEITKEFAERNNNDISLSENLFIQNALDFWCKTEDLQCWDGIYIHPDRI